MDSRKKLIDFLCCSNRWENQLNALPAHTAALPSLLHLKEEKNTTFYCANSFLVQFSPFTCPTATFHIKFFSNSWNTRGERQSLCWMPAPRGCCLYKPTHHRSTEQELLHVKPNSATNPFAMQLRGKCSCSFWKGKQQVCGLALWIIYFLR